MKRIALLLGAVVLLGVFASPALADCTVTDVHNAIAQWANVPLSEVTDTTQLDGLGGKSWPQDAPPLIADIEQMCGCQIPPEQYETFDYVSDIDGGADVDDYPEE
jgi:acyl carrier protein